MKKQSYNVKAWNYKEGKWERFGSVYLDPEDSIEQKEIEIEKIQKRFNTSFYLNISNFFSVYN